MGNDKITFKYNEVEIVINKKNGKVNVKNDDNNEFDGGLLSVFKSIVRVDKLNDLQTIFKSIGEDKSNTLVIDQTDMEFLMQFTQSKQSTDSYIKDTIEETLLDIEKKKNTQNVTTSTKATDRTTIETGTTTTASATATETTAIETTTASVTTTKTTSIETTTANAIATQTTSIETTTASATATETTSIKTTTASAIATETTSIETTTASVTATETTRTEEILAGNNAIAKRKEEICENGYSINPNNSNERIVKSGDNLWKIAKAVLRDENSGKDPTNNEIMDRCAQIACWNGLDNDFIIHPGDKLIVKAHSNAGNTGDETVQKTDSEATEKASLTNANTISEEIKTSNDQKELDIEVDKTKQNNNFISPPFADGHMKAKEIYNLVKGVNYNFDEKLKNILKKSDYITTENVEYIVEYWNKEYSQNEGIIEALTKEYNINVSEMEIIPKKLIERAKSEGLSDDNDSNLYYLIKAVDEYDNDSKDSNDYRIKDAKKIDHYMNEVLRELKQKRK